ncbi:long-chain-fatty-acid--CoA ligase [Devosia pacifica]|uniref:Long-chain-fatty-acid--CoA ligase n=1 Tax=Devosia pacifica TaxID=1335967 RepID=A0A918RU31_9HYPH|nr:class I adenylate-forming enzyme family protein [Devosia pacifica]GHA10045.1 long-chain-fatty-acid--CoA ligase [Devosia pacifica]
MLLHSLLLRGADRQPDKLAFTWVDRTRSLSYAQAATQMDAFAGALAECGLSKGDRVTIVAHNGLDYLMTMFAAWRLGAIAALVNVKFADELDYYFNDHQPRIIVYTHDMHEQVRAAAAKVPSVTHLLCMDGPQYGALSLPELVEAGFNVPADPGDEDAIAHLSYTSGTTGKPKGACLAHEPTCRATRSIAERLRITADDISFGPTALSSSYQLVGNLLPQLDRMASINVMGRWTQSTGWDALDAAGATMLIANPPVLTEVLDESRLRGKTPGRLRLSLSGGGPVPPTLKAAWRDVLDVPLVESYGQSELGGFVALGMPHFDTVPDSSIRVGPPLPDKEVQVFGPDHTILPVGQIGELRVRGGFMHGYWGKPEKTAEVTANGWLHTGDIGFIDRDGYITMRGRRSELIHVDGTAWFPRDIEEALCRQPGISQAALVGMPQGDGQRPVAFVIVDDGAPDTLLDALVQAIQPELGYDLSPLTVQRIDAMPMTPTGKISKAQLVDAHRHS